MAVNLKVLSLNHNGGIMTGATGAKKPHITYGIIFILDISERKL